MIQGCWDYPIPWPEDAYKATTKSCFLCGKETPYWCNHCVNTIQATDFRLHLETKWGTPLPTTYILGPDWNAPACSVICEECHNARN